MSKSVRPMVFRTLDGEPVVPSWLRRASQRVMPAPFTRNDDDRRELEPDPHPGRSHSYEPPAPPPRRSSLPPRLSMPPPTPQVVITRPPPPPFAEPPPPPPPPATITPAEQEAFALAALELGSLRARLLSQTESQLIELAVSLAEAIIEREIERDPAIHAALARAAVAVLGDTNHAKLRVSRAAYKAISQIHGEAAVDVDGVRVELTLDNSLEGLSVIAESGASRVDGRVSERLAAVLRALEADHRRQGTGEES